MWPWNRKLGPRGVGACFSALLGIVLSAGCIDVSSFASGSGDPNEDDFTGACVLPKDACVHGRCQRTTGGLTCACEAGFSGNTCSDCGGGQQDKDGDGTCSPNCGAAQLQCGEHAGCDDASGTATCACAEGYVLENKLCVWRGGPKDPAFSTPGSWTAETGVVVDAKRTGQDPGGATFSLQALCAGARVKQSITMPNLAQSEPFALRVFAADACTGPECDVEFGAAIDGRFVSLSSPSGDPVACLGDRAYGRTIELALRGWKTGAACETGDVVVDRVEIVPEPTCPLPGKVAGGDFEAAGSWISSSSRAEVAARLGVAGSRAGHLTTQSQCDKARLTTLFSVPSEGAIKRPALAFEYKGTTGRSMTVYAADRPIGRVVGGAVYQRASLCLPEWAKGNAMTLSFSLDSVAGLCSTPLERDFTFDELAVVHDDHCPEAPLVLDGSFSERFETGPWTVDADGARAVRAGEGHTTPGSLELSANTRCSTASAKQWVFVPPLDAKSAGGPALEFSYRRGALGTAEFFTWPATTLETAQGWTKKRICLDPRLAGGIVPVELGVDGGPGTCSQVFSMETMSVDDVALVKHPSCPTK